MLDLYKTIPGLRSFFFLIPQVGICLLFYLKELFWINLLNQKPFPANFAYGNKPLARSQALEQYQVLPQLGFFLLGTCPSRQKCHCGNRWSHSSAFCPLLNDGLWTTIFLLFYFISTELFQPANRIGVKHDTVNDERGFADVQVSSYRWVYYGNMISLPLFRCVSTWKWRITNSDSFLKHFLVRDPEKAEFCEWVCLFLPLPKFAV